MSRAWSEDYNQVLQHSRVGGLPPYVAMVVIIAELAAMVLSFSNRFVGALIGMIATAAIYGLAFMGHVNDPRGQLFINLAAMLIALAVLAFLISLVLQVATQMTSSDQSPPA